jgi:hypothetical protein
MAITINSTPQTYNPAYNDIVFVVTSDNVAQSNFRFVADVYVGGQTIRLTCFPDAVYSTGVFNLGRVIESYVSQNISKSTYGFAQNTNSYAKWYVKFGEIYGTTPTVYTNLTTSSDYYSWNSIFDFVPFQSYTQTPYVLQQAAVKQLLTNKPTTVDIRSSEDAWLYAATATSGTIYYSRVRTFDSAGATIQTVLVANTYQAVSSDNDRFIRFGCGTSNLNNIASSGVISGSQPIITASVSSYDVTFQTFSGTLVSTPQVYRVNDKCTQSNTYRFHFLNKLGGFDSFTFIRGSKKTSTINRSKYNKVVSLSTSSTTYGYSLTDREVNYTDTRIKDNIKVFSDWITEDEMEWLEELITSPVVYLDDATNGLIAVNILNSTHEFKQEIQDKLFNLEIEFEYNYERTRQRI